MKVFMLRLLFEAPQEEAKVAPEEEAKVAPEEEAKVETAPQFA